MRDPPAHASNVSAVERIRVYGYSALRLLCNDPAIYKPTPVGLCFSGLKHAGRNLNFLNS
jgi:hypothetical protein